MLFKYFTCLLILLFTKGISSSKGKSIAMHRESHIIIKLVSWNKKYFHYANMTTTGGTTLRGHTKHPWGNNITTYVLYESMGNDRKVYNMSLKMCDLLIKLKWTVNFLKEFSDIAKGCPIPAGEYHAGNLQLIPKYAPFMDGKTEYDYTIRATHTTQKDDVLIILLMNRLRSKRKG